MLKCDQKMPETTHSPSVKLGYYHQITVINARFRSGFYIVWEDYLFSCNLYLFVQLLTYMTQRERAIVAFILAWGVFFLNLAGGYFSWYSGVWWYDMLMHFSGGIMIGTVALVFAFALKLQWFGQPTAPRYGRILLIALFAIIFWEGIEFSLSTVGGDEFHVLDSLSDMFLGTAGALFVLSTATVLETSRV